MSYAEDMGLDIYDMQPQQEYPLEFRTTWHTTKDEKQILIQDMDDKHLFNTWKKFGGENYFKEMVYRLFEIKASRGEE